MTDQTEAAHAAWCEERGCTGGAFEDWLAADRAAARAEGAERVLAAVEAAGVAGRGWDHILTAARAAAVTTSSAKSSDLATRVPQDESLHTGSGS